jgi:hypothetical protein
MDAFSDRAAYRPTLLDEIHPICKPIGNLKSGNPRRINAWSADGDAGHDGIHNQQLEKTLSWALHSLLVVG